MEIARYNKIRPVCGVGGRDPREHASKKYGEEGLTAIVERVQEKAQQLLKPYTQ